MCDRVGFIEEALRQKAGYDRANPKSFCYVDDFSDTGMKSGFYRNFFGGLPGVSQFDFVVYVDKHEGGMNKYPSEREHAIVYGFMESLSELLRISRDPNLARKLKLAADDVTLARRTVRSSLSKLYLATRMNLDSLLIHE